MGQYYHQILETKVDGKWTTKYFNCQTIEYFKNRGNLNYYNGLKLLEHSWWGNFFCKRFAEQLVDNPSRVAWVGDYAEDDECKQFGFLPSDLWDKDVGDFTYLEESKFSLDDVKYLVNNTKKIYIDLPEYKKQSNNEGWVIFPISLLCAIGNGRGGGDYHDRYPNFNIVGSWTFDEIYLTNNLPEGYTKEEGIYFIEN